jgi:transcriptional regulator with XRE-family HTH domain
MTETVTYTKALALNIIKARGRIKELTQRGLASRMQALGFDWRQQTVARVELAKRPVAAEEILGLALALETTIQELLSPSETDQETPVAIPSGETLSSDYVTSLVYGMKSGAVTWTDDKPEFGPETRRSSPASLGFVKLMRQASSSRDTTIRIEDAAGTAATFTWPGTPPPVGRN